METDHCQIRRSQVFTRVWRHFHVSPNRMVVRLLTEHKIDFCPFIFHKPNLYSLIAKHFGHKTYCGLRKLLTVAFAGLTVFLITKFALQNGGISTFGSSNSTISKMSRYSNPVYEYSCIRMWILLLTFDPQIWSYAQCPKLPVWEDIFTPLYIDPGVNISYNILTPGSIYRNDILTPLTIFWPPPNSI